MSADTSRPQGLAIEVRRDELVTTRSVSLAGAELAPGEALLRVDAFALTSNNVTYAAMGEAMGYWSFFPASESGWGRVPAFGFADVVSSRAGGLEAGERLYGYLPMATHLVVSPSGQSAEGFSDGAPHRAGLPSFYNRYLRTAADPGYDPAREAEQMLLRPLFATSFLIDDALAEASFHGARTVVISSASSKTAFGTALLLAQRGGIEVVALTSPRNAGFVRALGCYDRVLTYGSVDELDASQPTAYVDMSGNGEVRAALRRHLRDALKLDLVVGATHHRELGGEQGLPGPEPTFFFAPGRSRQRTQDWGKAGLLSRIAEGWTGFLDFVTGAEGPAVLTVTRVSGSDAVRKTWAELVGGQAPPAAGHVASLNPP